MDIYDWPNGKLNKKKCIDEQSKQQITAREKKLINQRNFLCVTCNKTIQIEQYYYYN